MNILITMSFVAQKGELCYSKWCVWLLKKVSYLICSGVLPCSQRELRLSNGAIKEVKRRYEWTQKALWTR